MAQICYITTSVKWKICNILHYIKLRGREAVTREAHNLKIGGSNPPCATKITLIKNKNSMKKIFFFLLLISNNLFADQVTLLLPDSSVVQVEMKPVPAGTRVNYDGVIATVISNEEPLNFPKLPTTVVYFIIAGSLVIFGWASLTVNKKGKIIAQSDGIGLTSENFNAQLGRHVAAMSQRGEIISVTADEKTGVFETETENKDGSITGFSLERHQKK
jgi:hypothetical protein